MIARGVVAAALACASLIGGCGAAGVPPPDHANEDEGTRGLVVAADTPGSAATAPASNESAIYERSHAVVVGVDRYESLPRLTGAVRDARGVAAALEARGFETTLLVDGDATRDRLTAVLGDELPQRLGRNDRVVVYFAGHGVSVGQDDRPRMGYLMPVGGQRERPVSSGVAMSELTNWFNSYAAKHVLFVADACYSGLALASRSTGISPETSTYLADITSRDVRYALVAGTDDQEAHEWQGQGVFTRFLLEGMGGQADLNRDGFVTSDELATYVKPRVAEVVGAQFRRTQTPQSARLGQGEMVFAVARATGPEAPPPPADAVSPPPAREPTQEERLRAEHGIPADVPLGGASNRSAIQSVVRAGLGQVRRCYEAATSFRQDVVGTVQTVFVIDASGRVAWSRIAGNDSGSGMLAGCVLDVLGGMRFPASEDAPGVIVQYPFVFREGPTRPPAGAAGASPADGGAAAAPGDAAGAAGQPE